MLQNLIGVGARVLLALAVLPLGASAAEPAPLVVAFVYVTPIGEAGWSHQHELGRREMERALGARVRTIAVESVAEGADAERVMRDLVAQQGARPDLRDQLRLPRAGIAGRRRVPAGALRACRRLQDGRQPQRPTTRATTRRAISPACSPAARASAASPATSPASRCPRWSRASTLLRSACGRRTRRRRSGWSG